ncbi:MAG TPA: 3-hydroxylacyl-ACP dehydratase [Rhodanobacteraceae bacterium]
MPYPSPAQLLPHAGPAILIDAILDDAENHVVVGATITAAHPYFVAGHGVPVWVGIEMMAQAVAAHGCLSARRDGAAAPRQGMLLGTRHFDGHVAWFVEGAQLSIHAERAFGHDGGGMAACDCRIESAGQCLAQATIIVLEMVDHE